MTEVETITAVPGTTLMTKDDHLEATSTLQNKGLGFFLKPGSPWEPMGAVLESWGAAPKPAVYGSCSDACHVSWKDMFESC